MNFTHDFTQDCLDLLAGVFGEPIALARFCDGEFALLTHKQVVTADGWVVPEEETPFTAALRASLEYHAPGYHIGISPPCCLPAETRWYTRHKGTPEERCTFANVLVDGNHKRVVEWAKEQRVFDRCAIVACAGGVSGPPAHSYQVPRNAVNEEWDIDGLVRELQQEERPILVAAGPAANIIVHRYWAKTRPEKRVSILDVGSIFDVHLHGVATRGYLNGDSPNRNKVCSWTKYDQHSTR